MAAPATARLKLSPMASASAPSRRLNPAPSSLALSVFVFAAAALAAPPPASAAGAPLDAFLAPVARTRAAGGELGAAFAVADAAACAQACLANASCISFNLLSSAQPPTKTCGIVEECWAPNKTSCPSALTLSCVGGVFTSVAFASYGLPVVEPGECAFARTPSCDAPSAVGVFESACVGKSWCSVDAELATFGADPCSGVVKFVAASLVGSGCSDAPPPPGQLMCELSGRSRVYSVEAAAAVSNASYYLRLQPRNDSRVAPAVAYALDVPAGGVALEGSGLLARAFATNLEFLANGSRGSVDDLLFPYRRRHNASQSWPGGIFGWDDFVPGSVASMLLMGAGGALRWTEHAALRARLVAVVEGIAAVAEASGFAVGYPESDTNADMNGNNQLPSYVNSWFTHGMLEAAAIDPRALDVARAFNTWWNNCSYLPQLFPQDGSDDHEGPAPTGYDPARGMTSSSPFAHGHMLYWLNQAGIGHSRMAVSRLGTQADVDFLQTLFREDWWLDMLAARNESAIYARKWYPDNCERRRPLALPSSRSPTLARAHAHPALTANRCPPRALTATRADEVCVLECYLDLYTLTGEPHLLDAVRGGWELFRDPVRGWLFPGGSFSINENYLYPPGSFPLEFKGSWGVTTRPTGEFCPSAFWVYLNKRFHRLFPLEEAYVLEMERSIINVGMAGQSPVGVRYFARLHGEKDPTTSVGTCCEGQSVRVFGAAPEHIFTASAAGDVVSVDLFEASTISIARADGTALTVTIATAWPFGTRADVLVSASAAVALTLNLRVPAWAQPSAGSANVSILVDGAAFASSPPGSYAVLALALAAGAGARNVSIELAMAPAALPYTGVTQKPPHARFAYTFGPFLLAALGPWDAGLDCVVVAGVNASAPAGWLAAPPGTPPGALPAAGVFGVAGAPAVSFETYYTIGSGKQFTAFPIVGS